ncbi:3-deoxy-8-phosphooctulonate synthase [Elusimicrobiota bacterium]
MREVKIKDINVGSGSPVFVAGPCISESLDMLKKTAQLFEDIKEKKSVQIIMKISYDKANRTALDSYRGPGLEKGLEMITAIKAEFDLPVIVDIHCKTHVDEVSKVADCIQIPAFLCRQTDLLIAAGSAGKPVNIKKGQFMSPWAMGQQAEKISLTSGAQVLLTERGTSFGYHELVVDMRSIIIMRNSGCPVLFDATHSQQQPPVEHNVTKGRKEFIIPLAKAAMAVGADGIYCEVHPEPEEAESDRDTQLNFKEFEKLIDEVSEV